MTHVLNITEHLAQCLHVADVDPARSVGQGRSPDFYNYAYRASPFLRIFIILTQQKKKFKHSIISKSNETKS